MQTSANTYFNALLTSKDLIQPTVAATYTAASGSKIVLNATATVKTDIMNIFGYDQVTIKSHIDLGMGQHAAAGRAGARQHRLDVA